MRKIALRGVAYTRFSSDLQREESIDAQLRAIREYAERNNITIVHEYIDRAKSATTDNRPEFLRMVKESASGDFQVVLVHKLDRFARNRYDSAHYKHQLRRNNVRLCSVVENLDDSPESIIMESVLEGMAEYYSKNLAREVEKGKKENALQARHVGGVPPLGYDVDRATMKLVVNEDEAECVRLIFRRMLEGYSYGEIIDELNRLGYKSKQGKCFTKNSLYSILKNPKYTGLYIYNRSAAKDIDGKRNGHLSKDEAEIIKVENGCPVIINAKDFKRVQEKMKTRMHLRKSSQAIETYLLRGKVVCGVCGGAYVGSRRRRSCKGEVWVSYGCNKRHRNQGVNCDNREISKHFIEHTVLEKLAECVFGETSIKQVTEDYNQYLKVQIGEELSQLRSARKRQASTQREIDRIVELLLHTQSNTLIARLDELEAQRQALEQEIARLEDASPVEQVTEQEVAGVFAIIRKKLMEGTLQNIREIIHTYISSVVVSHERVLIIFNFFPGIDIKLGAKKESSQPQQQELSFMHHPLDDDSGGESCKIKITPFCSTVLDGLEKRKMRKSIFRYNVALISSFNRKGHTYGKLNCKETYCKYSS